MKNKTLMPFFFQQIVCYYFKNPSMKNILFYFNYWIFFFCSSFINFTFFYCVANITNKLGFGWIAAVLQVVICILMYFYKKIDICTYILICFSAIFLSVCIWCKCEEYKLLYPLLLMIRRIIGQMI